MHSVNLTFIYTKIPNSRMVTYDIITVGSGTVDVFAKTESELVSIQTASHTDSLLAFAVGSKILIEKLVHTIGGGGTNTAVGFSRLGLKTGWVGCIGTDVNAQLIQTSLKKERVAFLGHTSKSQSGYSIVLNSLNHDRTILTYKGANNDLKFTKLSLSQVKAKAMYFSSMVGDAFVAEEKLAAWCKKKGGLVAFNPSSYHVSEGLASLKKMLGLVDILIFNKEEAQTLCGVEYVTSRALESGLGDIFAQLHEIGISVIVITDAANPVFASVLTGGKCEVFVAHPQKVKCVESTGAGDAFSTGFVSEFINGGDVPKSLKSAIYNSQSVISHHGAKEKLLTKRELSAQLRGRLLVKKV